MTIACGWIHQMTFSTLNVNDKGKFSYHQGLTEIDLAPIRNSAAVGPTETETEIGTGTANRFSANRSNRSR